MCGKIGIMVLGWLSLISCANEELASLPMGGTRKIQVATSRGRTVTPPSPPRLPMATVFKGEAKFHAIVAMAERENWRALPLSQRITRVARELVGTRYVNYTLEVDDRIESPVVNLTAMDCWTYYENALAIARMLRYKPGPYQPQDMLHMVELERYRNGICTGSYLSRMHQLEEVFSNNQQRTHRADREDRGTGVAIAGDARSKSEGAGGRGVSAGW